MGEEKWGVALFIMLFWILFVLGRIGVDVQRIREALTAGPVVEQEVE